LIGIGPVATNPALARRDTPISGELHNDYLAGFLERGVLGGLGLLALCFVVSMWSLRVGLDRALASRGWVPTAFCGGTVAVLISAASLETLHFRHVWLFFALLIALGLSSRELRPRAPIYSSLAGTWHPAPAGSPRA
jgi:O-antigen ligase